MSDAILKEQIIQTLEDLKAIDIKEIDVHKMTTITDWMIICEGRSTRQIQSLADNLAEKMKEKGIRAYGISGKDSSDWVLVDFNDVVVHIMTKSAREFYNLEKLWEIDED